MARNLTLSSALVLDVPLVEGNGRDSAHVELKHLEDQVLHLQDL